MIEFLNSSTLHAAIVEDEPDLEIASTALSADGDGYASTHPSRHLFASALTYNSLGADS